MTGEEIVHGYSGSVFLNGDEWRKVRAYVAELEKKVEHLEAALEQECERAPTSGF